MVLYNVTVSLDESIHDDWLNWMRKTHIPDMMQTGLFLGAQINQVITDEDTGITYAIQYTCQNMETLEHYQSTFAPALQAQHSERYKGRFGAFRTLLKIVDRFEP